MTMYHKLFSPRCLLAMLLEESWISGFLAATQAAPVAMTTATQNHVLTTKLRPVREG